MQDLGMGFEVGANVLRQFREGGSHALVNEDESAVAAGGWGTGQGIAQHGVAWRKQVTRKDNPEGVLDNNFLKVDVCG